MSYKISVGSQVIGDLKSADDAQRDTLIDFGGNGSITSESFSAGDRLTLKFQHSDTGITTSKHAAILRILTSTA